MADMFPTRGLLISFEGTEGCGKSTQLKELHARLTSAGTPVQLLREPGGTAVGESIRHLLQHSDESAHMTPECELLLFAASRAQLVRERLESSRLATLQRTALLLDPHKEDPSDFYANDPKAKLLPRFLCELHQNLADEHRVIREEMFTLNANIEHIKEVVSAQQSLARSAGVEEKLIAADLLDDAVRIHLTSIKRHEVQFETDYTPDLGFVADRHNTLQILVNLVSNAIHAVKGEPPQNRRVKLRTQRLDARVRFEVADLGVGISEENMTRVFQHGFTTRDDGHGFGLHSGALAAKRMGGSLTVTSAGPHQGATFLLELPLNPSDRLRSSVPHPAAIDSASL